MDFDINWLAVLAGTVAHQMLGALWYGVLFRTTWLNAMGMTREEIEAAGASTGLAFGAMCSLVSVVGLAMLMTLLGDPSVTDGIAVGAVCGIAFVAASAFMNGFYEQKKPVLAALFGGYYTIGLIAAGAILGAWK